MAAGAAAAPGSRERWVVVAAAVILAATLAPYLYGRSLEGSSPPFGWYSWFAYNFDDSTVYLSWLRQAADGHFFQRNLFTTEPQSGRQFNLFFLVLGGISRLTGLPPIAVWHGARILLGLALLLAVWGLCRQLLNDPRARAGAFLMAGATAGFGWVPGLWELPDFRAPVDVWQPEAITFLSVYLNPLFTASLLLMVAILRLLLAAAETGSFRPALAAGLLGFLLGNIHTYDVITLAAVWAAYLAVRAVADRDFGLRPWLQALAAGALTSLSTGYMAWLYRSERVFTQRAEVPTLSPAPGLYVLGWGLALLLAAAAVWRVRRWTGGGAATLPLASRHAASFLIVWAVMNVAAAYLPVPFQRKMVMGAHLPICLLAGIGLASLARGRAWGAALACAVAVGSLTCLRALWRDVEAFRANRAASGIQRLYLYAGERHALEWIRRHAPPGAPVQPLPWIAFVQDPAGGERRVAFFDTTLAALTPGLTGHPVHAGHWGETPDFGETMGLWRKFLLPTTDEGLRRDIVRLTGVRYLVFSQKHDETGDPATESGLLSLMRLSPPPWLRLIPAASSADADVYEVVSSPSNPGAR